MTLQLSDHSYRFCRLGKAKPAKRRRVLSVTFFKNADAPDILANTGRPSD